MNTKSHVTCALLHHFCYYDSSSGELILQYNWGNKRKAGALLGSRRKDGYKEVMIYGSRFLVHHLIWLYFHGELPAQEIDHIDGNPWNNKIENLREASHKENLRNTKKHKNNTSGFTGVYFNKATGRWQAYAKVNYRANYIGLFDSPEEAAAARAKWLEANYPNVFSQRHGK